LSNSFSEHRTDSAPSRLRFASTQASRSRHLSSDLLDTCRYRPRQPGCQVFPSLRSTCSTAVLTWSTRSPMYSCACRCPQVSATAASHPASWSLDHDQHPPFTTVVDRHAASLRIAHDSARLSRSIGMVPHDLHLAVATASELHTCASQTKRYAPGFEVETGKPSTRPTWTWHTPPGVTNRSRCVSLVQSLRLDLGSPLSQSPRRLDSSCTV